MRQLALICIFAISNLAFAADRQKAQKDDQANPQPMATPVEKSPDDSLAYYRNQQKWLVKAGDILSYQYDEPSLGVKIKGSMPSVAVEYKRIVGHRQNPIWWSADASYAWGNLTYSGSDVNLINGAVTPDVSGTKDSIFTSRGRFGVSFFDTATHDMNVYVGVALWHLQDSSSGPGSYDRKINYFYAPIGIEWAQRQETFLWTASFELNPMLIGTVESDLSQANSSLPNTNNTQLLGIGGKLLVSAEWNLGGCSILVDVYDQYWAIPKSDDETVYYNNNVYSFYEPANNTNMAGAELGFRF